jgi:hypothetical protein
MQRERRWLCIRNEHSHVSEHIRVSIPHRGVPHLSAPQVRCRHRCGSVVGSSCSQRSREQKATAQLTPCKEQSSSEYAGKRCSFASSRAKSSRHCTALPHTARTDAGRAQADSARSRQTAGRRGRCTLCTVPCARAPAVSIRFVSVSWAATASLPRRQLTSLLQLEPAQGGKERTQRKLDEIKDMYHMCLLL